MKLFLIGVTLVIISWIEAWGKFTPFHIYTFFPLWFGYFLTINGVSQWYFKTSLLQKMGWRAVWLFIISIPFWWLFEFLNTITHNWQYQMVGQASPLLYFLLGSISFSTVIPALSSAAYLFFQVVKKFNFVKRGPFQIEDWMLLVSLVVDGLTILLVYLYPNYFYPLLWWTVILFLEPVNYAFGFPSIIRQISRGYWGIILAASLAAVFTGFWWELWNFYSSPKWTYSAPFRGYYKIFEIPLEGFVGYFFFGLEMFSFCAFFFGLLKKRLTLSDFEDYFLR